MEEYLRTLQGNPYLFLGITVVTLIAAIPAFISVGLWCKAGITLAGKGVVFPWKMISSSAKITSDMMANDGKFLSLWSVKSTLRAIYILTSFCIVSLLLISYLALQAISSNYGIYHLNFRIIKSGFLLQTIYFVIWTIDFIYSSYVLWLAKSKIAK